MPDVPLCRPEQLQDQLAVRVSEAETEAAGRKRADEQLEQIRRQVEQLQDKAAAATASTSSGASDPAEVRELKKYNDDLLVSHRRFLRAVLLLPLGPLR